MLQTYLREYAVTLDETTYQVQLKDDLNYGANQSFEDGSYWSTPWFSKFWKRSFLTKLRHVGVQVAPGSYVLDCACGQGYLGESLETAFGTKSILCDLSRIQLAEFMSHRKGVPSPIAVIANLLCLPFRNQSFDFVVGNSFLHHLQDVPAALREINRVTKPGGKAVFFHEPTTTSTFWESFPVSLLKDTSPTEDWAGFTDLWMFTICDLERLIKQAGFTEVRVFGSGILSAVLLNWYFFLAIKNSWRSNNWIYPAYLLKVWLTQLDLCIQGIKARVSPSAMVVAQK
jgi:ubiquinone/menaquinone biosynthesis C-methylase UbiE